MGIAERLQMVIKMNGLTNSSFADRIGVQRSSVSHVLSGRNKPSVDFIQKILQSFPKVDANWLVAGRKVGKSEEAKSISQKEYKTVLPPNEPISSKGNERAKDKKIERIIIYYDDKTFEEMLPAKKIIEE